MIKRDRTAEDIPQFQAHRIPAEVRTKGRRRGRPILRACFVANWNFTRPSSSSSRHIVYIGFLSRPFFTPPRFSMVIAAKVTASVLVASTTEIDRYCVPERKTTSALLCTLLSRSWNCSDDLPAYDWRSMRACKYVDGQTRVLLITVSRGKHRGNVRGLQRLTNCARQYSLAYVCVRAKELNVLNVPYQTRSN